MKVVWLVSNYPHRYNLSSGIFHKQIAETLVEMGIDLTILALTPYSNKFLGFFSKKWDLYRKYPKFEYVNGVKVYRPSYISFPNQNFSRLTSYLMFWAIYKNEIFKDSEIIHAHYAYPFGFLARLISRKTKIPFIITLHGDDVNIDPFVSEKSRSNFVKSLEGAAIVNAVSKALAITANSLTQMEIEIFNLGLVIDKTFKRFFENEKKTRFKFIFVGALTRDKGMHLILRLLEENKFLTSKNYSWLIIGEGPFADEFSRYSNVILTGGIPNYQVLEYMKDSDLMVFPSLNEGMPHVLKEAGSVALPIVASDVGGIPDLLNCGERGEIFRRDDYDGFKSAILNSISNYDMMLEKGRLLQTYIYQNYDLNKNAQQLIGVYKKVLYK